MSSRRLHGSVRVVARALCLLVVVTAVSACKSETAEHKAAGNMLFNQGKYDEARVAYEKAKNRSPADPGARILLGNAYFELRRYEDARGEYAEALRLHPDSAEGHRGMMAVISHTATPGDREAFARYLGHADALIAARPKDKQAIINAGKVISEAANPADPETYAKAQTEAEATLRRALTIDDRDPALLFHLALVYARQNQREVALRVVDRIAAVEPQRGFHVYTAAIVFAILGDRDQALARVEELLTLDVVEAEQLTHATSYLRPLHDDPRFQALIVAARK
jgi:tetratricopeptide (TPR) repeat protein